jgi:hypothetical protein
MVDHEAVFAFFAEEMRTHGGAPVRSVVAYGSSLTDEFRPGVSDYNFLVVAEPVEMDLLDRLAARGGKWRKKRISPPLVITPAFVDRALDSYPMEFLSMAARHRVLSGEDPLAAIVFKEEHVRLQCEREIWSKILLFRRAYLESEGAPRRLQHVIERGYSSIVAIYRGMLFLKRGPWQATGEEFRAACDSLLGVSSALLRDLQAVRGQRSAPAREQIHAQIGQVLAALERLAVEVDQW